MKVKFGIALIVGVTLIGSASTAKINLDKYNNEECQSTREWCENQCTSVMEIEAVRCSMYGFTAMAAICHGVNMAQYGGCLSECLNV